MRCAYLDEDSVESEVADKILFLIGCPELSCKTRTRVMFHLNCLCLQHVALKWPKISFGFPSDAEDRPNLSEVIEPVHCNFLLRNPECEIFTETSSDTAFIDLLEKIAEVAFKPG